MRRLLAVGALAIAILAAVAILAPRPEPGIEPGISTTSAPPGEPSAELPDPCELVTTADAQAALGGPVVAAREGTASCVYAGRDDPDVTVRVDVATFPDGKEKLAVERSEAIRAFGAGAVVDIEGLGDAAFLTLDPGSSIALVWVASGDLKLVIGVAGPVPDAEAIARDLAATAVDRR